MKLYHEIFCDYDGVLVNWLGGVAEALGDIYATDRYNAKEHQKERGDLLAVLGPEFWANLKPMPDYEQLWSYLKPLDPAILTAYPSWCPINARNAMEGKVDWNSKYTQVSDKKLFVVKRDDKQLYAKTDGIPNILIDDYKKNIKQWESAGGIGIYHKSAAQTIERLNELRSNHSE